MFGAFFSLNDRLIFIFNYIPHKITCLCFSIRFDLSSSYGYQIKGVKGTLKIVKQNKCP